MYSVTQRIKSIKQPRGGYINPNRLNITPLNDRATLNKVENISPSNVGLVVDYLSRAIMGASLNEAFMIPLYGAQMAGEPSNAVNLLHNITGLDDLSIKCASQLTGYDVCVRVGVSYFKPVDRIDPDKYTIENIRTLVNRSKQFWDLYGPMVKDGFTFKGGYTDIVSSGDGDFLTKDTLWDFKVSKYRPKADHTLQILMYYLLGIHSIHPEFKGIDKLGIYNPRLNEVYRIGIGEIEGSVIEEVSTKVLGYR